MAPTTPLRQVQNVDGNDSANDAGIEGYRLHVSQRWLDLTRRKLELARIPREPPRASVNVDNKDWGMDGGVCLDGASKAEVISLLDYWSEFYDHRAQEEEYNHRLPQYRTYIPFSSSSQASASAPVPTPMMATNMATNTADKRMDTPNTHFVHRRSLSEKATPFLFLPEWGASFVYVARVIDALCEPISTPTPETMRGSQQQAFHVVCPSLPGFGFSDASPDWEFGIASAAELCARLMEKLGYHQFVIHGDGWGFIVARSIALKYPERCIAIHTAGLDVPRPRFLHAPIVWLSYHLAWWTATNIPFLGFGYVPSDFETVSTTIKEEAHRNKRSTSLSMALRPRTLAYALADSPTGLLALMFDLIGPLGRAQVRAQSNADGANASERQSLQNAAWLPSDVIMWTMMYWLPGPEAPLRWLRNAISDSRTPNAPLWRQYSFVPLGVSCFRLPTGSTGGGYTVPPAWATAYQKLIWVTRHSREVCWPAWEAPEELVIDIRNFVEEVVRGSDGG